MLFTKVLTTLKDVVKLGEDGDMRSYGISMDHSSGKTERKKLKRLPKY